MSLSRSSGKELESEQPCLTRDEFLSAISGAIQLLVKSGMKIGEIDGPATTQSSTKFCIAIPPQSYVNEIDAPRVTVFMDQIGKIFPTAKISALRHGGDYRVTVSMN